MGSPLLGGIRILSPDFLSESLFYCVLTHRRPSSGSLALGVVGGSVVVCVSLAVVASLGKNPFEYISF